MPSYSFLRLNKSSRLSLTPIGRIKHAIAAQVSVQDQVRKMQSAEGDNFMDEMRSVALKLHSRDQSKEGEQEPDMPPIAKWQLSLSGCLRYLVNIKIVYNIVEAAIQKATHSSYAKFRNTGLERSDALRKDLEWFKEQGYTIPEPSSIVIAYAPYLEELSEKDQHAFICHFYNIYFAHTAGGQIIGKKVSEITANEKELEFYKWDGNNPKQLAQDLREKLNEVAANWSREEKDRCLEETKNCFKYMKEIHRLILSS